jgi:hypothetical protein
MKADASIRCHDGDADCFRMEIVSGVLRGKEGAAELFTVLRAIKDLQPSVNASTGTHVHVRVGVPPRVPRVPRVPRARARGGGGGGGGWLHVSHRTSVRSWCRPGSSSLCWGQHVNTCVHTSGG